MGTTLLGIAILLLAVSVLCLILLEIKRSRSLKPDKDCGRWSVHPSKRGVFIPTPLLYTFNTPVKRQLTAKEVDVIKYAYQLKGIEGYVDTNDMVLIDDGAIRMYILLDELEELVEQL